MSTPFDPNTISLQALAQIVYGLANPPPSLTLDQLTARGAWQGSDLIPVLPSGALSLQAGTAAALAALISSAINGAVPYVSGALSVNTIYMMNTAAGALNPALPASASVAVGDIIVGVDVGDNAGTNNVTYTANGSDVILDHATSAGTWPQYVNNTVAVFLLIASGKWRVFVFSG